MIQCISTSTRNSTGTRQTRATCASTHSQPSVGQRRVLRICDQKLIPSKTNRYPFLYCRWRGGPKGTCWKASWWPSTGEWTNLCRIPDWTPWTGEWIKHWRMPCDASMMEFKWERSDVLFISLGGWGWMERVLHRSNYGTILLLLIEGVWRCIVCPFN